MRAQAQRRESVQAERMRHRRYLWKPVRRGCPFFNVPPGGRGGSEFDSWSDANFTWSKHVQVSLSTPRPGAAGLLRTQKDEVL